MAFCTKCGNELRDGDKFCYHCGAPVKDRNTAGRGTDGNHSPSAGTDIKKLTVAVGIAVLVLSGIFVGANMRSTKESAVQVAENQDSGSTDAVDSDAVDVLKKADPENVSSDGTSSGNLSDKGEAPSSQASGDVDSKEQGSNAQELAMAVIESIEKKPRYGTNVSFEPLAVADGFNGEGIWELLAVYELRDNENVVEVMYGLWSLQGEEPELLEEGVLFTEAGGNFGIAGIVEREGITYLATQWSEPAGERFNQYYSYVPMSKTKSALESSWYYMEGHGSYTDETTEGRYILGDTKVDKSEFEAKIQEFSSWVYELDLLKGPEGGVKTFEEMKKGI